MSKLQAIGLLEPSSVFVGKCQISSKFHTQLLCVFFASGLLGLSSGTGLEPNNISTTTQNGFILFKCDFLLLTISASKTLSHTFSTISILPHNFSYFQLTFAFLHDFSMHIGSYTFLILSILKQHLAYIVNILHSFSQKIKI